MTSTPDASEPACTWPLNVSVEVTVRTLDSTTMIRRGVDRQPPVVVQMSGTFRAKHVDSLYGSMDADTWGPLAWQRMERIDVCAIVQGGSGRRAPW